MVGLESLWILLQEIFGLIDALIPVVASGSFECRKDWRTESRHIRSVDIPDERIGIHNLNYEALLGLGG